MKNWSQVILDVHDAILRAVKVTVLPANTGLTTLKTDLTTTPFEVVPVPGQKDIIITSLSNIRIHFSLSGLVTTDHVSLSRDDQIILTRYSGSVFIRMASGTGTVQIDQRSRV